MDDLALSELLIVGGSPGTHGDLERLCAGRIDLRFVTEETTPNRYSFGQRVTPLLGQRRFRVLRDRGQQGSVARSASSPADRTKTPTERLPRHDRILALPA